eukprot:GILJ01010157.1.p1 GENE.GILJ01010157.1~~GILJ01010157.1.p1  ORF type:complete len:643 (+),score=152.88 GILJ01010157.1:146-2074(+)
MELVYAADTVTPIGSPLMKSTNSMKQQQSLTHESVSSFNKQRLLEEVNAIDEQIKAFEDADTDYGQSPDVDSLAESPNGDIFDWAVQEFSKRASTSPSIGLPSPSTSSDASPATPVAELPAPSSNDTPATPSIDAVSLMNETYWKQKLWDLEERVSTCEFEKRNFQAANEALMLEVSQARKIKDYLDEDYKQLLEAFGDLDREKEKLKRQVHLIMKKDEVRSFLSQEHLFKKHCSNGTVKVRSVYLSNDLKRLVWKAPNGAAKAHQHIAIANIRQLQEGRQSQIFKKIDGTKSVVADLSFSIVTDQRTLDLEAETPALKDVFLRSLNALVNDSLGDLSAERSLSGLSRSDSMNEKSLVSSIVKDSIELTREISNLKTENTQFRAEIITLSNEKKLAAEFFEAERTRLKALNKVLEDQLLTLQRQIRSSTTSNGDEIQRLTEELAAEKEAHFKTVESFKKEMIRKESAVNTTRLAHRALVNKFSHLQLAKDTLMAELQAEKTKGLKALQEIEAQREQDAQAREVLQMQIEELNQTISDMASQHEREKQEWLSSHEDLSNMETAFAQMVNKQVKEIEEKEVTILNLHEEIKTLKLLAQQQAATASSETAYSFQRTLQDVRLENSKLLNRVKSLEKELRGRAAAP